MDKNEIKLLLPKAVDIINKNKSEYLGKNLRNKMSAFGATVIMNGLVPAIAGYKKNEKSSVVTLICEMAQDTDIKCILNNICQNGGANEADELKITDAVMNYVIAYKLAFDLLENKDE